ncbi:MAG TPA: FtsX-like permease family protein, partial [Blastocatellia bacterium]|nr:FtsX-like permease family protein [Blastocatellia bacterium]
LAHETMVKEHPEAYSAKADFRIDATMLRDQITSRARTVLLILLASSGLIFIIACSNVANLILARTVRREGELAIRAALGATNGALRRTLLAETVLLCGAGALIGVLIAQPMVAILARYISRFSVRALDVTVDSSMLWVGASLAVIAAVLLAFVPRLPSAEAAHGLGLSNGSPRITGGTGRRLRIFAMTQIAASFVLLAGAGMLLKTLIALQTTPTGFDMRQTLALNVPVISYGRTPDQIAGFYKESMRRISELPGVERVAVGAVVPWRDTGFGPGFEFSADGYVLAPGEEYPRARFRTISPGFFAALGVPLIAGRDFNDSDRRGGEPVVIVSQSVAQRMFSTQETLNRHVMWTDPVMKFIDVSTGPRRIVGVVADVDDENVVPGPAMTVYHPFEQQELWGGRLFIHTRSDPYALVSPVTRIIRELSSDQPIEGAATLEDIRAEVLAPERLNTIVFGGFALLALVISVVGVAGVLAFSISARSREFAIRLALGAHPRKILSNVLIEGMVIAVIGVAAGAVLGFAFSRLLSGYIQDVRLPGALPLIVSIGVIIISTVVASMLPAARAARVDVMQALRAD